MTDARPALFAHRLGFTEQPVGLRWRSGRRTVTEFDLMNFVTTCGFSEITSCRNRTSICGVA